MTVHDRLKELIDDLPEQRLGELLDFAEFLSARDEDGAWHSLGLRELAKAYGRDEPEYSEADIKPWR